jgi:hypothetical protein
MIQNKPVILRFRIYTFWLKYLMTMVVEVVFPIVAGPVISTLVSDRFLEYTSTSLDLHSVQSKPLFLLLMLADGFPSSESMCNLVS